MIDFSSALNISDKVLGQMKSTSDKLMENKEYFQALQISSLLCLASKKSFDRLHAMRIQAFCYDMLGASDMEVVTYENAIEIFEDHDEEDIKKALVWIRYNLAITLGNRDEIDQAIEVYSAAEDAGELFSNDEEMCTAVAQIKYNHAGLLSRVDRSDEAIALYLEIIADFEGDDRAVVLEQVARARASLGISHMSRGESDDALPILKQLFGMREDVLSLVPELMILRAKVAYFSAQFEKSRDSKHLSDLKSLFQDHRSDSRPDYREVAAFSLFSRAGYLSELGKQEDAAKDFRLLLDTFSESDPEIKGLIKLSKRYLELTNADAKMENEEDGREQRAKKVPRAVS